jgi:hypothetical protein
VCGDCATGPCNVCPPVAHLCLAPLAPVASLAACTPGPPTCGPLGTFGAVQNPQGIAFDGTNMWVADVGSGDVTELSPAGVALGSFFVGAWPTAIAFDLTNMWVANIGSNNVTEL